MDPQYGFTALMKMFEGGLKDWLLDDLAPGGIISDGSVLFGALLKTDQSIGPAGEDNDDWEDNFEANEADFSGYGRVLVGSPALGTVVVETTDDNVVLPVVEMSYAFDSGAGSTTNDVGSFALVKKEPSPGTRFRVVVWIPFTPKNFGDDSDVLRCSTNLRLFTLPFPTP